MSDKVLRGQASRKGGIYSAASSRSQKSARTFPHYNMDHPRRGVAAIFNHESFQNYCGVSERRGSEKDVESLCRTLARLGFEVETFCDLNFKEVETTLEDLSQRDHSKCDCFVLVYMSHGLEGKLRSKDVVFDVNCLWNGFTPELAPSLANKPKIFIIQACQGHGKQCGIRVAEQVQDSSRVDERVCLVPGYILPSTPDFLVALSTIPGFVSWRSPQNGSWYIQTLCAHLDRQGFEQDLVTLLTHVGREIAVEYSVIDVQAISNSYKKQLPSIISFLVKKIQFTRKGSKSCGHGRKRKSIVCSSDSSDDEMSGTEERNAHKDSPKRRKIESAKNTV